MYNDYRYINNFLAEKPEDTRKDVEMYFKYFEKIDLNICRQIFKERFSERLIGILVIKDFNRVDFLACTNLYDKHRIYSKSMKYNEFIILYRDLMIDKITS